MLNSKLKNKSGFTLIELLIVLVIVGILLSYGIPSYRDFSSRSSIVNESNDLLSDIAYARVTAVKLGRNVIMQPLTASSWEDGWNVYLDKDSNFKLDQTDEVLRVKDGSTIGLTIEGPASIAFDNLGALTDKNTVLPKSITLKHKSIDYENKIEVALSGLAMTNN